TTAALPKRNVPAYRGGEPFPLGVRVAPFEPAREGSQVIKELLSLVPLVRVGRKHAQALGEWSLHLGFQRVEVLAFSGSVLLVDDPVLRIGPQQGADCDTARCAQRSRELVRGQVIEEWVGDG